MHATTTGTKSSPTTVRARVGIGPLGHRAIESLQEKGSSNGSITQSLHHSILPSPPRFVVTLESPLAPTDTLTRIPLAVTGKWVRDGNDFSITLEDLEEIVSNFRKRRNGEINVDYDHASEMPEVAAGGPIPSAGRIVKVGTIERLGDRVIEPFKKEKESSNGSMTQSPDDSIRPIQSHLAPNTRYILWGLYEPTSRARKLIESLEYRYISPAITWAGRDKRTGKIAGTTLTSVALTNRPFLEELPQIRLSDPAYQLVDVGEVHVDTSLGGIEPMGHRVIGPLKEKESSNGSMTQSPNDPILQKQSNFEKGGHMKQVKLSVEDGKVRVGHEDFTDAYYADPQAMKQCLDGLGDPADQPLVQELAELAGMPAAENGAAGEDAASPASGVTLSECVAEIRRRLAARQEISLDQAAVLLSENEAAGKSIPAADFFRWRVEQELDEAVKSGKMLPRQREDWRKIALSDFPTFRKIVAGQKPQVTLRPTGLSGSGPDDPQSQVKLLAEQRMRERQISFGQALSEIGREQPELVHQYRRSVSG
jgi:phage I-like protein